MSDLFNVPKKDNNATKSSAEIDINARLKRALASVNKNPRLSKAINKQSEPATEPKKPEPVPEPKKEEPKPTSSSSAAVHPDYEHMKAEMQRLSDLVEATSLLQLDMYQRKMTKYQEREEERKKREAEEAKKKAEEKPKPRNNRPVFPASGSYNFAGGLFN